MTKITDPNEILEACKIIEDQFDTYLRVRHEGKTYHLGPNKTDRENHSPVSAWIQEEYAGSKLEGNDAVFVAGWLMKVAKDSDGFTDITEDVKTNDEGAWVFTSMIIQSVDWVKVIKVNQKYGELEEVKDWKNYKYDAAYLVADEAAV